MTRYLILGNGAAGATAAEEIRRLDPRGEITLVGAERYPMYSRPGLAYLILDEIPERQVLARSSQWYAELDLRLLHGTASRLDVRAQRVQLADGLVLGYDRLLIATGARAADLPLAQAGPAPEGIVYLDTLDGTKELLKRAKRARRGVVVGGGITALEMAEGFAHQKVETHYFVRRNTIWSTVFNQTESDLLAARMRAHGVHIHYGAEVAAPLADRHGRLTGVKLTSGEVFNCDLLGVGIGVRPQIDLARGTPIQVDKAILVNEYLETSVPGVYAAGDCAQMWNPWTQSYTLDVLWPTAVAAGRTAGRNLAGQHEAYARSTPFNACLLFGMHVAAIGQLGNLRDEPEAEVIQLLSRGSSEIWATRPAGYSSAWSQSGADTLRLTLSNNRLVGALVIGNQNLADVLRDLIELQVDLSPLRPYLEAGSGAALRSAAPLPEMITKFWQLTRARAARQQPWAAAPQAVGYPAC